ncbi:MAG: ATP-dependent Clp protease adapter ClpS [Planctomycetota bacterium]|jgi:ATP-dependent Clp protease adaptor protein ClpS
MGAIDPLVTRGAASDDPPEGGPPDEGTEPGTQTATEEETETDASAALGFPWNVIVWDDPVNLMSYVVYVFQTLFGYPREQATRLMLEVHQKGRSLVASADREKGEYYVTRLHGYGLQATLERGNSS